MLTIRNADPPDARFLARSIRIAGRAHVRRGIWEIVFKIIEENRNACFKEKIGSPGMLSLAKKIS